MAKNRADSSYKKGLYGLIDTGIFASKRKIRLHIEVANTNWRELVQIFC